ncbi:hypothetical protein J2T17_006333 [Paenibacillus mucilaginosus]|uniref:SAVED domain-containing protein n=1 Tax=Paenibacillus mucilaginosus TaxID=61624 RepID=UPI003D22BC7D
MTDNNERERRSLRAAENYYLWTVSGGRCSYKGCNKLLILNEDGNLSNIAEKAHIIGHKGPRYSFAQEYGFTDEDLENVKNLMMMCKDHHKLIDDHPDQYPPDKLFKMKREHEEWVLSWGELKKKSIAIIHKRMSPPIRSIEFSETPNKLLIEAVELQEEFSDFTPEGWQQAKNHNIALHKQFLECMRQHKEVDVEVFPLSQIPLLIHIGILISDTVPTTVYQYDRENQVWVTNAPADKTSYVESSQIHSQFTSKTNTSRLVVSLSVSALINLQDIEDVVTYPFDLQEIKVDDPRINRILYREDVIAIQSSFKYTIESLIQSGLYTEIHLFYSGPAGLAVEIGRSINPRMWPEVYLYHFNIRNKPRYQLAFSV